MSISIETSDSEHEINTFSSYLTPEDQIWLTEFEVDLTDLKQSQLDALNYMIETGSIRLDTAEGQEIHQQVILARHDFLIFLGLSEKKIESIVDFCRPTLRPLSTLIETQRVLAAAGISGKGAFRHNVSVAFSKATTVQKRLDTLSAAGLEPEKVANAYFSILGMNTDTLAENLRGLEDMGLTTAHINSFPALLTYSLDSMKDKYDNLVAQGLDAETIVKAMPQIMGYNLESVNEKIAFLRRSTKLLRWEHTAEELIHQSPNILSYSIKKLRVLRRIAATYISSNERGIGPEKLSGPLTTPIDKYIIALSRIPESTDETVSSLRNKAVAIKLDAPTRKVEAIAAANRRKLGRVGIMYLTYRKII